MVLCDSLFRGGFIMPRIPITITEEMKRYFEEQSKKTGISQSALIVMMLSKEFEKIKKKE